MKKIDFLLGYEIKGRELESLCLLRYELRRRGYSAEIANFMEMRGKLRTCFEAEVFVSGGMRFWDNVPFQVRNAAIFNKHIEIPWEQVFQSHLYSTYVKRDQIGFETAVSVWGERYRNYLINNEKTDPDRVFICGHPVMDFCKPGFADYYFDRDQIRQKYNLDKDKKWCLFVSSFNSPASGEQFWIDYDKANGLDHYHRQYFLEVETQKAILNWFEQALQKRKDITIIYRPHPDEIVIQPVLDLENKFNNFRIIREEGIIQWLRVSDQVYTWISTSTAEAFFARKPSYVLRPVKVPQDLEIVTFSHSEKFITNYEMFEKTLDGNAWDFPVSDDTLEEFYYYDKERYTYMLMADLFEKVYKDDKYLISDDTKKKMKEHIRKYDRQLTTYRKAVRLFKGSGLYNVYHDIFRRNEANNHILPNEIEQIDSRIRKCIG